MLPNGAFFVLSSLSQHLTPFFAESWTETRVGWIHLVHKRLVGKKAIYLCKVLRLDGSGKPYLVDRFSLTALPSIQECEIYIRTSCECNILRFQQIGRASC